METILAVVTIVTVLFVVFAFSDDKELQKEVVEKVTDTVTDMLAENKSTIEILELTEIDEQTVEVQETGSEEFEEQGLEDYLNQELVLSIGIIENAKVHYDKGIKK